MNAQHISTQLRGALGSALDHAGAADPLACASLGLVGSNGDLFLTGESLRPVEFTMPADAVALQMTSSLMILTGDGGGNTIETIAGGVLGTRLTLIFTNNTITITDTSGSTADSVNLSASFTSSAEDTISLIHNGTKWLETSRSVN